MAELSPVKMAAAALMRHGDYCEAEDSMQWLAMEALSVANLAAKGQDAVIAHLLDTAWWDETQESDERARCVAAEVCWL